MVKSAVENYRVYLTQLQTYFAQKKDLNAKFTDEKGNEKTYAEAILDCFNSVRFLTALRASALGVEELNREIALALRAEKLLWFRQEDDWYIGKPIMITENDHNVKLYNGDIGLCLAKGKVWFGYREVSASRIPDHEPAFMMTIHKSQGSEFEHIPSWCYQQNLIQCFHESWYLPVSPVRKIILPYLPMKKSGKVRSEIP